MSLSKSSSQSKISNKQIQWSFLQYKNSGKGEAPSDCHMHSSTQIGTKILFFGGANSNGEPLNKLYIYDSTKSVWSKPSEESNSDQHPGPRYGHTATLLGIHPPKIFIWGGMTSVGTYEFDEPEDMEDSRSSSIIDSFVKTRKKGKKASTNLENDDSVYFLELNGASWSWTRPIVNGSKLSRPAPRTDHSACKISANEVAIFGGWTDHATNDSWIFNFVDCEWKELATSGIHPKARYRHTAEVLGLKMFILGGSNTPDDVADGCNYLSVHELDLTTMQWSHPLLVGSNPFPRSGHSSAVVGASMIAIFGGKRNNEVKYFK
jgi:hypothetical protein